MRGLTNVQWLMIVVGGLIAIYLILAAFGFAPFGAAGGAQLPPLADFVRGLHVHGVPYAIASQYPQGAVPSLLDWLENPQWEGHWTNIVITAGMIGAKTDAQVDRFIAFLEASPGATPLSRSHYHAKQAALMSLGYIANRNPTLKAQLFLVKHSEPTQWTDSQIAWQTPYGESKAVIRRHLSRLSILAMGLSGQDIARQRLINLRDQPGADPVDKEFRVKNRDIILEALQTHTSVRMEGLAKYYK